MPIAADLRKKYYGPAWQRFRRALIERHGTVCSRCGATVAAGHGLHLAHLDHDPRVSSRVALFCISCHSRYDSPKRVAATRRTLARKTGQLWLCDELEYAPLAESLWPTAAVKARQGDLF